VEYQQDRSDEADDGDVVREDPDIPSTRERRLISLLIRSMGLVDQILRQCARGNAAKASTSAFAVSISGPVLGQRAANSSRALSQAASAWKQRSDAILEVRSGRSQLTSP